MQQLIPKRRPVPPENPRDNIKLGHKSSLAHLLRLIGDCSDYDYVTCIGVSKIISLLKHLTVQKHTKGFVTWEVSLNESKFVILSAFSMVVKLMLSHRGRNIG